MIDYQKTELFSTHKDLKAKLVPFSGFWMPLQYSSIVKEHHQVRNASGLFDVSHMGEFIVSGKNSKKFIQKVTTNDVAKLSPGKVQYSAFCNHEGGVIDDLLVYNLDSYYMLVVNASNIEKNFKWLKSNLIEDVSIVDKSNQISLLALQGPSSQEFLKKLYPDILKLKYYETLLPDSEKVVVARTGYSGELGFEIYAPNSKIVKIWNELLSVSSDIQPVGLGCRDSLRLEMGYCLYGNELNEETSTVEAGLSWITKYDTDFIGSKSIKDNISKRLIAISTDARAIPRSGYKLFSMQEKEIGIITSGGMSPSLKKGIALAYVDKEFKNETEFKVGIRDKFFIFNKVRLPFYKEGTFLK
jgi:aminomethyltransferase|tara:strand:+ start:3039 stop:4109 length:1071 start_codon:yes stop_codon:yes gene_type:complete